MLEQYATLATSRRDAALRTAMRRGTLNSHHIDLAARVMAGELAERINRALGATAREMCDYLDGRR